MRDVSQTRPHCPQAQGEILQLLRRCKTTREKYHEEISWLRSKYAGLHCERHRWCGLVQDRGVGPLHHQPEDDDGQQGPHHSRLQEEAAQPVRNGLHHYRAQWSAKYTGIFCELNILIAFMPLPLKIMRSTECCLTALFSGQTLVHATIKKQSLLQLESSANIFIHDVSRFYLWIYHNKTSWKILQNNGL